MKTSILCALLFFAITLNLFSSQNIILQRGEQSFAFETLSDAINFANNGDILYLPSGNFDWSKIKINKGIHIIGAGYHPISTGAVGQTTITGETIIAKGADGGSMQGLNFTRSVYFGTDNSNNEVHKYTFRRCYFGLGLYLSHSWNASTNGSNFTIVENVIFYGICGGNANDVILSNNIIYQVGTTFRPLTYFHNAIISNNIIIPVDNSLSNYVTGCTFKNNIITKGNAGYVNTFSDNIYLNNLHTSTNGLNTNGVIQSVGNVYIERNKLFVNAPEDRFDFKYDYHLTQDALKAINGTDGTQVGIYGGDHPFKDGGAPINPQIIEKRISTATNPQGKLKVEIKVKAQSK